jgi:hypothetical protein
MPLSLDQSESLTEPFNRKTKRPLSPRHSKSNPRAKEESITKSPVSSQRIAGLWSTERLEHPFSANFLDTRAGPGGINNLFVRTAASLHQSFLWLHPIRRLSPVYSQVSSAPLVPLQERKVHPVRTLHTVLKSLKSACDLRFQFTG